MSLKLRPRQNLSITRHVENYIQRTPNSCVLHVNFCQFEEVASYNDHHHPLHTHIGTCSRDETSAWFYRQFVCCTNAFCVKPNTTAQCAVVKRTRTCYRKQRFIKDNYTVIRSYKQNCNEHYVIFNGKLTSSV